MENQIQKTTTEVYLKKLVSSEITIQRILESDSLSKIKTNYGEDYLKSMIDFLLTDLCSFFNLSRPITTNQIKQTTDLIIELYPHFKAEDIARCFKNIKLLRYGKLYEGLDGSKILDFINMYDLERQNEIVKFRTDEKAKYDIDLADYSDEYIKMLKNISESTDKTKELPKVPAINEQTKNMKGIFLEYENEFYKLCDNQKESRFVNYKEKMRDLSEYCNFRYEEDYYKETNNQNK